MSEASLPLESWSNFYVIVGSSAGGLTGLTFVVIALVADAHAVRLTGLRAFITPTIVHFGSALVISAVLNVPGQTASSMACAWWCAVWWDALHRRHERAASQPARVRASGRGLGLERAAADAVLRGAADRGNTCAARMRRPRCM